MHWADTKSKVQSKPFDVLLLTDNPESIINNPESIIEYRIVHFHLHELTSQEILVHIQAKSNVEQVIFSVLCNREGELQFDRIKTQFEMDGDHDVRWSQRFSAFEVIEMKKNTLCSSSSEIVIYRVDPNLSGLRGNCTLVTSLKTYGNFDYDVLVLDDFLIISCKHFIFNLSSF